MTRPRRDGNEEPYKSWIRNNKALDSRDPGLSITDIDDVIHRYKVMADSVGTREIQHIMFLEVKTFGAVVPFAQGETLKLVDKLLRLGDKKTIAIANSVVSERYLRCWGVHVLRFAGECPNTSEWIEWDGHKVSVDELTKLLRFDIDPDTLRARSDRRHHTPSLAKQLQPRLQTRAEQV